MNAEFVSFNRNQRCFLVSRFFSEQIEEPNGSNFHSVFPRHPVLLNIPALTRRRHTISHFLGPGIPVMGKAPLFECMQSILFDLVPHVGLGYTSFGAVHFTQSKSK